MPRKPKTRSRGRPKGHQQGRKLTQLQREMIVQTYAITGNQAEVARQMHISTQSVAKVLKEAESDLALQKARTRALDEVAGRVHGKAVEIIDSISPDDIESGLIKKYDDEGNLVSAKGYGPSLMQKVTSAAILTDKLKVIEETKKAIAQDHEGDPTKMPLPGDMQAALKQIGERVQRLRILDVQFAEHQPEIAQKVQEVAHKASLNEDIVDADYEELDFDNP